MKETALIIIDIQQDYFTGGAMTLPDADKAANNAAKVLAAYRQHQLPVIHVQHSAAAPELGFLLPNTEGQKIHPLVAPQADEPVVIKHYPNAFCATTLLEQLNGIKQVVIVGMMTHMCVSATTRATLELGIQATVISDACATTALPFGDEVIDAATVHKVALAEISSLAQLATTDEFISTL
uniref:cysteine hydrolase family protein n=1 Tax=Thaumasiovibrio occultus TaxID=1891184 RepID=UPI000B35D08B|nr:cysteine hydrolase family protein [Thaumasiovibrio occultus]